MTSKASPSIEQLRKELAVVAENGVGRPLKGEKTERDIPGLAAIAREMAGDPTLPLTRLIAEVVVPAVKRLHPDQMQMAAAAVLWLDLDEPPEKAGSRTRENRGLDEIRYPEAAALLGYSTEYFKRHKRRPLLEAVAEQVLALYNAATSGSDADIDEQTPEDESPSTPTEATAETALRKRALVAAVGVLLVVIGAAWMLLLFVGG